MTTNRKALDALTDDEAEAAFFAVVETFDRLGCCPAASVGGKDDAGVTISLHFSADRARKLIAPRAIAADLPDGRAGTA